MNPVLKAIEERRTVRNYEQKPVPRDIINRIIEAANQAPSAMNSQPWRFVVVEDREFHKKLIEAAIPQSRKRLESFKNVNPERY